MRSGAAYTAPYASISVRQLSRPDKSGNSRFEYTKILNGVHAGTLSGACAGAHMCQFIARSSRSAYASNL
ncbi:MAG TPA: hypothetical protein PLI57_11650, partial [Spirochaetota bacterium]|nr:hypothetical protein [Spirochaetota bacterium]